jgi:hypothetical protein
MVFLSTVVDTKALEDAVLWGFAAGIGVTTLFTLAVVSAARFTDLRRSERVALAALNAVVALVALAGFLVAIGFGIKIMTTK